VSPAAQASTQALAGCGVVVTRPEAQAGPLCLAIEAVGGRPIRFPVLEILDPPDADAVLAAIDRLDNYDMAIFISPNAVNRTMNLIRARRQLPATLKLAAIGRGTARELKRCGIPTPIYPRQRFNSEALLAMDEMQAVSGTSIVVFRGDGGRELLGDTLRARGARVDYVETYRRARPDANVDALMRHWARGEVQAVVVTSGEALRNLFDMVGKLGQQWLRRAQLVVLSERTAELAGEMGFKTPPIVADEASDQAVIDALAGWWADCHRRDASC
jgi:uroporphyrinogen-III synthase